MGTDTKNNYIWRIVGISIVIVIFVVGIKLFKKETPTSGLIKVKIGLSGSPDILDVPYFIALEKGFFKEEGLDIFR